MSRVKGFRAPPASLYAFAMVRVADPAEEQYAYAALRLEAEPTPELLTMVRECLLSVPGRTSEERFELLAMKADVHQAKLRARRTGS